jgi:hypothetical protein
MGYESRLYVMQRRDFTVENKDGDEVRFVNAGEIARFDMSKMVPSFRYLFTEGADFVMYGDDGEPIEADCYGDRLAYAPARKVAEWLEAEVERSDYRRLKPLLAFLKAAEAEHWDGELIVVHYGY